MALKILLHRSSYQHSEYVELVKEAVHYAVDFFNLHDYNWRLEIYLVNSVDSKNSNSDIMGQHHYIRKANGKEYSQIYISCAGRYKISIVHTIFHELTHLKQILKKEVTYSKDYAVWKSQTLINEPKSMTDYYNQPHEKDARRYANILFVKYTMQKIKQYVKQLLGIKTVL